MIDFKISRKEFDGERTTVLLRVYFGAVTTELELDKFGKDLTPVKRYRRERLIDEKVVVLTER